MTRQELENNLSKIGWKIFKSGNGLNDFIINHKEECTKFVVTKDNKLEVREKLFGGEYSFSMGTINFDLSESTTSFGSHFAAEDTENEAKWVSVNFTDKNYILFFNHD